MRNKVLFYVLSWTWGLLLNIVGAVVALVLIVAGKKPKKWGYCYYFEVGKGWGGMELGMFFLVNENPSVHIETTNLDMACRTATGAHLCHLLFLFHHL